MSELKPCPFCGKPPAQFGNVDAYRCKQCGKHSGWMSKKDWNARSDDELVKALEELVEHFGRRPVWGSLTSQGQYLERCDDWNRKRDELCARIASLKEGKL